eukprot:1704524-Rhodomonas_salina.1
MLTRACLRCLKPLLSVNCASRLAVSLAVLASMFWLALTPHLMSLLMASLMILVTSVANSWSHHHHTVSCSIGVDGSTTSIGCKVSRTLCQFDTGIDEPGNLAVRHGGRGVNKRSEVGTWRTGFLSGCHRRR